MWPSVNGIVLTDSYQISKNTLINNFPLEMCYSKSNVNLETNQQKDFDQFKTNWHSG